VRTANGTSAGGGGSMSDTVAQLNRSGVQILRQDEGVDPLIDISSDPVSGTR
jgi:hypothetical protein